MRMMLGREASAAAAWAIVGGARDSATAAKARVVKVGLMGIRGVRVVAIGSWVLGLWQWRRGIPTTEIRFQGRPHEGSPGNPRGLPDDRGGRRPRNHVAGWSGCPPAGGNGSAPRGRADPAGGAAGPGV